MERKLTYLIERLNEIRKNVEIKEKNAKSLNYALNNTKNAVPPGQKRKEALENIKDYLGKFGANNENEDYKKYQISNKNTYENHSIKNKESDNKRLKLNDNSKKFIIDKIQELSHQKVCSDKGPSKITNSNINRKTNLYNLAKK